MTGPGEGRLVAALLLVTVATGLLDAVSLLHLGTFTGYMTGTVILVGVHLTDRATRVGPGVIALATYLAGALLGGRLVRRHDLAARRLIGDVLLGVALLIGVAAVLEGVAGASAAFGVVALLGLAMGLQTSATRHAGVPDMALPAATMILHGLAYDSRLAGGGAERTWRRLGVLAALLGGHRAVALAGLGGAGGHGGAERRGRAAAAGREAGCGRGGLGRRGRARSGGKGCGVVLPFPGRMRAGACRCGPAGAGLDPPRFWTEIAAAGRLSPSAGQAAPSAGGHRE